MKNKSFKISLMVELQEETSGRITINLIGDLVMSDRRYLYFHSMITRKCVQHPKLQIVNQSSKVYTIPYNL